MIIELVTGAQELFCRIGSEVILCSFSVLSNFSRYLVLKSSFVLQLVAHSVLSDNVNNVKGLKYNQYCRVEVSEVRTVLSYCN